MLVQRWCNIKPTLEQRLNCVQQIQVVEPMLVQCWSNIVPALVKRLLFAGKVNNDI